MNDGCFSEVRRCLDSDSSRSWLPLTCLHLWLWLERMVLECLKSFESKAVFLVYVVVL